MKVEVGEGFNFRRQLVFSKDRVEFKDQLCLIMVHLGHEKQALSNDNSILLE
jgi:hypothetical protein